MRIPYCGMPVKGGGEVVTNDATGGLGAMLCEVVGPSGLIAAPVLRGGPQGWTLTTMRARL